MRQQHVFLTGEIQVGKSTLINRVLEKIREQTPLKLSGFRTIAGNPVVEDGNYIHMVPADKSILGNEDSWKKNNRVFERKFENGKRHFLVYREVFETLGAELLSNTDSDLILMDEIGTAEADCDTFHQKILDCLDGAIPVFGVVQIRSGGFLDEIRNHKNVCLVEVTRENRERLVDLLAERITEIVTGIRSRT